MLAGSLAQTSVHMFTLPGYPKRWTGTSWAAGALSSSKGKWHPCDIVILKKGYPTENHAECLTYIG